LFDTGSLELFNFSHISPGYIDPMSSIYILKMISIYSFIDRDDV